MTQKEYKEKIIDKFVLKIYETNLYLQGKHLLYLIKPKNTEYNDSRLIITYNVVDASQPTQLYFYNTKRQAIGVDMFDKVEIDGTEVSVADLDAAEGKYQLSAGEHTVLYTLKDPTFIGSEIDVETKMPTKIGATLSKCDAITNVTIPNSVTIIGDGAFSKCQGLRSVTIPNSVTSIGKGAFANCGGLTSIGTVGSGASVEIPNSVTSIGEGAFIFCDGLESVTIPNSVTSIGNNVFQGCSSLTSIEIPSSVTSISSGTFEGCSGLTSVTIPNSVTSIGEDAFDGCSALTSVTIPNSVTSIGNYTFCGCPLDVISKAAIEAINPNATSCGGGGGPIYT